VQRGWGESELGRLGWELRQEKSHLALPFPSCSAGKEIKTPPQNVPPILKDKVLIVGSRQTVLGGILGKAW